MNLYVSPKASSSLPTVWASAAAPARARPRSSGSAWPRTSVSHGRDSAITWEVPKNRGSHILGDLYMKIHVLSDLYMKDLDMVTYI